MGEVFITRKGGGGKAAAPTLAVTSVGGSFVQLAVTNNDQTNQATIFILANYDINSATDFDLLAAQNGTVINVAANTTVSTIVSGLDPDTSHTVSAQAAVIKKLSSSIVTTETINLSGTGVTAPTVGPITANNFTSTTFTVTNNDTVVSLIIKANITENTTAPTVYPFESSALAASATGSITVSDLTSATVYYIHARSFDGTVASSNVVFGPYTQSSPIVATGGTITNYSDAGVDYRVHTFTGNGTFAVTSVPNITGYNGVHYLIVAGGGGGGNYVGGGAGAGGLLTNITTTLLPVTAQNYGITVGSGGTFPGSTSALASNSGANSVALGLTAIGGGAGGRYQQISGVTGGSGGGGGGHESGTGSGAAGTTGQGFAGGNSTGPRISPYTGGGGGGGANGVGGNSPRGATTAGAGGPGRQVNIDNNNHYWAGGGGGGNYSGGTNFAVGGLGGIGGGGGGGTNGNSSSAGGAGGGSARNSGQNGSQSTQSTGVTRGGNGGANTGGGSGGAGHYSSTSGNGGSGIVVIRYVVGGTV